MKKCPFCAEEIQDEAIKCKHCGEFLDKTPVVKWYFRTSILVIALLSIGPFALPLLWFNPHYSTTKKIVISLIIIILTYFLSYALIESLKSLKESYQMLMDL